jgi:O-antigen ligase
MTILQFFDIAIFNENILKNNIKYFSAFSDYNIFMLSLLTSIFIILSNIKKDKSFLSFYIFNIIIIFLFGFLSGSRRSMIYLLFYILVFSKFTKIKQKKVVLALFLATLSIFIILIVFIDFNIIIKTNPEKASNAYFSKINRILSSYSGEREIYSERFDRWNKAMNVIKKFSFCQIIIGLGTRSYYSLEEFIRPGGSHDYPHNFILSAFIEGGIIKTILVLIISLYPLSFLIKKTKIKDEKKRISVLLLYSIWLIDVFFCVSVLVEVNIYF